MFCSIYEILLDFEHLDLQNKVTRYLRKSHIDRLDTYYCKLLVHLTIKWILTFVSKNELLKTTMIISNCIHLQDHYHLK